MKRTIADAILEQLPSARRRRLRAAAGRAFVAGAGFGALAMYVLDPQGGRRRRALARDQAIHVLNKGRDAVDATARDMANRARGVVAEARALVRRGQLPDDVVAARVHSKLGHWLSHPGAIEVDVRGGRVTLAGPVLASEAESLMRAVRRIRGVASVEDRLEVHAQPDIPALQGGVARPGERFELMQTSWSPAARVIVGALGAAAVASAALRRDVASGIAGTVGFAALARAITNRGFRTVAGDLQRRAAA